MLTLKRFFWYLFSPRVFQLSLFEQNLNGQTHQRPLLCLPDITKKDNWKLKDTSSKSTVCTFNAYKQKCPFVSRVIFNNVFGRGCICEALPLPACVIFYTSALALSEWCGCYIVLIYLPTCVYNIVNTNENTLIIPQTIRNISEISNTSGE